MWLTACAPDIVEQESYVFGTRVQIQAINANKERTHKAIGLILSEFDRLHVTYHAWKPSELSRLNVEIAAGNHTMVSPELCTLLRQAKTLAAASDGLFDPGIGTLVNMWGFHDDEFAEHPPAPDKISAWLKSPAGMANLRITETPEDHNLCRISSTNKALAIDFGGYLKGVALDRAAGILRAHGIRDALINIGGNIMALGSKSGHPWSVGIQHPRGKGVMATLELRDGEAIGISGDYRRYFQHQGRRYHHLLDPRSGKPAKGAIMVAVLVAPGNKAGLYSDVLNKPLFIVEKQAWPAMAKRLGATMSMRMHADGELEIGAALLPRLKFIGKAPSYRVVEQVNQAKATNSKKATATRARPH